MTTIRTPEQYEGLATMAESLGDTEGARKYRGMAAGLRTQAPAHPSRNSRQARTPAPSDDVVTLHGVDTQALERGWGNTWNRPKEPCAPEGEITGVIEPENVQSPQIWLTFQSTDGNFYSDFIAIPYQTTAAGKLGDVLRAIGIPYDVDTKTRVMSFAKPSGYPCRLIFQDKQGRNKDEVRLVDVQGLDTEAL